MGSGYTPAIARANVINGRNGISTTRSKRSACSNTLSLAKIRPFNALNSCEARCRRRTMSGIRCPEQQRQGSHVDNGPQHSTAVTGRTWPPCSSEAVVSGPAILWRSWWTTGRRSRSFFGCSSTLPPTKRQAAAMSCGQRAVMAWYAREGGHRAASATRARETTWCQVRNVAPNTGLT